MAMQGQLAETKSAHSDTQRRTPAADTAKACWLMLFTVLVRCVLPIMRCPRHAL